MPRMCIQCEDKSVLKGEDYCDNCYDMLSDLPNKFKWRERVERDEINPVFQVAELIARLTLDEIREVILILEQDFFIKANKLSKGKGRRVPTYRWIEAGEYVDGCTLNNIESKTERILAHILGKCKNKDCQRGFMKVRY